MISVFWDTMLKSLVKSADILEKNISLTFIFRVKEYPRQEISMNQADGRAQSTCHLLLQ
jgi:hypothetical protein